MSFPERVSLCGYLENLLEAPAAETRISSRGLSSSTGLKGGKMSNRFEAPRPYQFEMRYLYGTKTRRERFREWLRRVSVYVEFEVALMCLLALSYILLFVGIPWGLFELLHSR